MTDFFALTQSDKLDALNVCASQSGLPPHLLEKDIWVVYALQHLFNGAFAKHLVFKGGTSLSKAYGIIRRFSEDVDLTYDIRAIASDIVGSESTPLPKSRSQEKKWSNEIKARLSAWVLHEIVLQLNAELSQHNLPALARAEGCNAYIEYKPLTKGTGYIAPAVMLEFGARSTGEPSALRTVKCDAAQYLSDVVFPIATPKVMRAERTFWEKATAIHAFAAQGVFRGGGRFARHWHDIARLDTTGFADAAIADIDLAHAVASHKNIFFSEKNSRGEAIDYHAAVTGGLTLVPSKSALAILAADYSRMIDDGLFLDDVESFETLIQHCQAIEEKANAKR
jgi:hypothetical protein